MKLTQFISSPLLSDLRHYQGRWFQHDFIAGLSVAAVQVPTAVAYAQLAGFSPEVGLYASILPVIVYAFFGSSKQLVVGPDAATCTMVASLVAPLAAGDPERYIALSSALSLAAGTLMMLGGTAGMGFIVNFFARPILSGFLNGIAASIIVGQAGKLLGVSVTQGDFLPTVGELIRSVPAMHVMTFVIGAGTLILLALLKRFAPKAPSALIALVVATVSLVLLGGQNLGVKMVGALPAGLPHVSLPSVSYHAGQGLFVSALGLVIVSFTSGMLTARSIAARSQSTLDANREMFAIGAANLASGFCGAFAVTGADSRTAVNASAGNKTQLSSVFAALSTAAVATFFTAPLGFLPLSALAAVLIFSAAQLFDFRSYKQLRRIDKFEFRLSILTTIGVLGLGVLPGVALAIACALIVILYRIYKPEDTILGKIPGFDGYQDITLSDESEALPDIILWRFEGPLVFFNADYFKTRALEIARGSDRPVHWFILSLESVSQMDTTGLKALGELQSELANEGIELLVARPKMYMRRLRDESDDLKDRIVEEKVFYTIREAVKHVEDSNAVRAKHS